MSPQAIQSLIEMFGVEKGLQILNLFTAMDDTELSQQRKHLPTPPKNAEAVSKTLDLPAKVAAD